MNRADASGVSRLQQPGVIAFLLGAVTFLLFSPALGYGFINYDDNLYVYENPHVLHGFSREGLVYAFQSIDGASWMPVTWLSFMLDTTLFGMRAAGNHLTNILLHSASAGLLFLVLQRMTKATWTALLVAAVFAWHPQRLESVAWVAERKDVLSVFFFMLGLLAYVRHAEQPGWRRMAWVAACLVLGVMSKPIVVSFPLILLLLDFWPLRRLGNPTTGWVARLWPLIKEKIPLFLICAAIMVATVWSQGNRNGILVVHFPWYLKLFRITENVWFYGRMFFCPTGLSLLYRTVALNYLHVLAVGAVLAAVTVIALRQARQWPWLAAGWFWFLFSLAPVAGFIRIGDITVADRYSYLPAAGLAIAVFYSAAAALARWPRIRSGLAGVMAAWLMFCAAGTWADLPRWQNTYTIFESAYRHGAHFVACDQLAAQLYLRQEYQQAITVCNAGMEDNNGLASLYNTRGGSYLMLGDADRALADFSRAIEMKPSFSPPYFSRAMIHSQRKQYAEARADIKEYQRQGGALDPATLNIPPE
ncbi:MAG TPA: hypothetical protein VG347_04320 [Verrucomicrobiae bacterium]|nr:hypothetical protein [Verrucomicrobiae bacterium]